MALVGVNDLRGGVDLARRGRHERDILAPRRPGEVDHQLFRIEPEWDVDGVGLEQEAIAVGDQRDVRAIAQPPAEIEGRFETAEPTAQHEDVRPAHGWHRDSPKGDYRRLEQSSVRTAEASMKDSSGGPSAPESTCSGRPDCHEEDDRAHCLSAWSGNTAVAQDRVGRTVPRILIAEDNDDLRSLLTRQLRRVGYEVLSYENSRH